MTFSKEWDDHYAKTYSFEGFYQQVELMLQHVHEAERCLELGCGVGNNVPSCLRMGFGYHGIDGVDSAISKLKERFPQLSDKVAVADFSNDILFKGPFDMVFDRASVSHNDLASIKRTIATVGEQMKKGALYVGVDWFSYNHSELSRGDVVDARTRTNYPDGQFKSVGNVCFLDEIDLFNVFEGFELIHVIERVTRSPAIPLFPLQSRPPWFSPYFCGTEYRSCVWDFIARKR